LLMLIVKVAVSIILSLTKIFPSLSLMVPVCVPVGLDPVHIIEEAMVSASYFVASRDMLLASTGGFISASAVLSFWHITAAIAIPQSKSKAKNRIFMAQKALGLYYYL